MYPCLVLIGGRAGAGACVTPVISDYNTMAAMFAPFEEPTFCRTLDIQALQRLVNQPLAARCPVPASHWPHFQKGFLRFSPALWHRT